MEILTRRAFLGWLLGAIFTLLGGKGYFRVNGKGYYRVKLERIPNHNPPTPFTNCGWGPRTEIPVWRSDMQRLPSHTTTIHITND